MAAAEVLERLAHQRTKPFLTILQRSSENESSNWWISPYAPSTGPTHNEPDFALRKEKKRKTLSELGRRLHLEAFSYLLAWRREALHLHTTWWIVVRQYTLGVAGGGRRQSQSLFLERFRLFARKKRGRGVESATTRPYPTCLFNRHQWKKITICSQVQLLFQVQCNNQSRSQNHGPLHRVRGMQMHYECTHT